MDKEDARSLPEAAREEKRKQVIRLRRRGTTYEEIAEQTGLSESAVVKICHRVEERGLSATRERRRGRREAEGRNLSPEQEQDVQRVIADKTPDQLKLTFALWSRTAVRQLIQDRCGVKLAVRTVGNYLARWGFTPQKPIKKAYEQRPEAVRQWLDDEYPVIAERAKAEGAEIHWGDETGLRSDDVRGRSYAPRGQTPVIRVNARREGLSIISTVTNQGKVRWKVFDGALNTDLLIDFFERLIKDADRKVFLILDNLRVHHAKLVKARLAEHEAQIEVFYLPSYSPELNPDEMLNADLKQAVTSKAPTRSKGALRKAAISHLRRLHKSPARVRKYFQHPPVKYAA
jgi:transposase